MAQKKSYSRYFIILQEDEKGYAIGPDKLPSGYVKLETKNDKCKVSFYVQNLKKEKAPYHMVLICHKKDSKKILCMGEMNIDDYGRADLSYEYNTENLMDSRISSDKVSGAAIVRLVDSNIISVMSGFATTDVPEWKNFEVFDNKNRSVEEKVEQPASAKIEDKVQQPADDKVKERADKDEVLKVDSKGEEPKSMFDKYEEAIPLVKTTVEEEREKKEAKAEEPVKEDLKREEPVKEAIKAEEPEKEQPDLEEPAQKEEEAARKDSEEDEDRKKKHCHEEEEWPKGSMGDFFKALVKGHEECKDLCPEIKRCKWFKIPVKSLEEMYDCSNYNKYTTLYYPMISYYPYIKKCGHFMVGYKHDEKGRMKYLVYGVPGMKCKCDQPYGGKSGFVTWIPMKKGEEEEHSMGYWLMFYDFRNSTIVIPMR